MSQLIDRMKYLIILTLILLVSCTENKIGGAEFTIIQFEKSGWVPFENAIPSDLSYTELIEIENIIGERVVIHTESFNRKNPEDINRKRDYIFFRQYVPVTLENGDKVVWVNFACEIFEKEKWKNEVLIVMDGGPCFFQLKVNLTNGTYYEYYVNGVASR